MSGHEVDEPSVLNWYEERGGRYMIAWECEDGPGLYLGEPTGRDDDHKAATEAARKVGDPEQPDPGNGPLVWDSKAKVRKALIAAKAAIEVYHSGIPVPDWAIKAKSEGWNPPKGWVPRKDDDLIDSVSSMIEAAHLEGGAIGWDAAGTMAASGVPAEVLADMCRKNAQELRAKAGK